MLALRLPKDVEDRLDALALRTGRTKSFYARAAIVTFMDDLEDRYLAEARRAEGGEPVSLEALEAELIPARTGR